MGQGYDDLSEVVRDWRVSLFAKGRSPRTVNDYWETADAFRDWLVANELPTDVTRIQKRDIEGYLGDMRGRKQLRYTWKDVSPATVAKHYRNLRQLFRYLHEEEIIEENPFARMSPPKTDQKTIPIMSMDEIGKLLASCNGRDFLDRRDQAIMRLLLDTGMRVSELTSIKLLDVDFNMNSIVVMGKGSKERIVGFGDKSYEAIRRYLRLRQKHPKAESTALWIAEKGALTHHGVRDMLTRRSAQAGVPNVHPHRFRHQFAHEWLAAGGTETDLMRLAGWASRQMLDRYGASAASARAIEAHRRAKLGDRY